MNKIDYLIISSSFDYSTDYICIELEKRKKNYLRINRDFFSRYKIMYDFQKESLSIKFKEKEYIISNDFLKTVYFRSPVFLRNTGKVYSLEEQLEKSQWNAFIRNLIIFDKARWVNHPVSTYQSENKLYQLRLAIKNNLKIPETYVGNCLPQNIINDKLYVVKSLDTAYFIEKSREMFTYSTIVKGSELITSEISLAPVIIQNYIKDKVDIRVTIIGNILFPVAITKNGSSIQGDWRKFSKENLNYTPVHLPENLKLSLLNLMYNLGLVFGGVDLVLVGNEYYFIEVNPTGEWGWLRNTADLAIDKAIVEHIINGED